MAESLVTEEDDELLTAAGKWASVQHDDELADDAESSFAPKRKSKRQYDAALKQDIPSLFRPSPNSINNRSQKHVPESFSLHLTKVPFDSTQSSIRGAFTDKGCRVKSVRLVCDTDQKSGVRVFRGVAFVDFEDEYSFTRGLELHRTTFLGKGRKVNVRQTKTQSEISEIARKTKERVAELIARSKLVTSESKRRIGDIDVSGKNNSKKKNPENKKKRKESRDANETNQVQRIKNQLKPRDKKHLEHGVSNSKVLEQNRKRFKRQLSS